MWSAALFFGIGVVVTIAFWRYDVTRRNQVFRDIQNIVESISQGQYQSAMAHDVPQASRPVISSINQMVETIRIRESGLSEERDVLHHILQSMTTGVVYINADGRIQMLNEAAERLFRRPAEQCMNSEHWTVFHHYHLSAAIDQALLFGHAWRSELRLRQDVDVDVRLIPMQMDRTLGLGRSTVYTVLVLCTDVSQWHRLERMRSDFVANVSHELKTPITAIQGFAETLMDNDVSAEERTAFLQVIRDEGERMGSLVADLLTLSKLESEDGTLSFERVKLTDVLESALVRVQSAIEKRNLNLVLHSLDGIDVWGDVDKLLQVFLNLLTNAVHYTPSGGTITVWADSLVDRVKVHIKDTGVGIAEEHLSRIFERFYRVDRDRSRATGGTGLGLAIVKHIVSIHGGELGVESELGKGSEFWFTLARIEAALPNRSVGEMRNPD